MFFNPKEKLGVTQSQSTFYFESVQFLHVCLSDSSQTRVSSIQWIWYTANIIVVIQATFCLVSFSDILHSYYIITLTIQQLNVVDWTLRCFNFSICNQHMKPDIPGYLWRTCNQTLSLSNALRFCALTFYNVEDFLEKIFAILVDLGGTFFI